MISLEEKTDSQLRFRPLTKKVVLKMEELPESQSGLILPDKSRRRSWADRGEVIAECRTSLKVGDVVLMEQEGGGIRAKDAYFCGQRVMGQIRFIKYPYWRHIFCKLEDNKMVAVGKNVILIADEKIEKSGEILLPDSETYRPGTGTVFSVGDECIEDLRVGDKVVYSITNCKRCDTDGIAYRAIQEKDIYCVIEC